MSAFSQSISDFESAFNQFSGEYDSDRNLAYDKVAQKQRDLELQGQELLNIATPAGFNMLSSALQRANVVGKITKSLDDFQSSLSPNLAKAFGIGRIVASDLLKQAPGDLGDIAGAATSIRGTPQQRTPKPKNEFELQDMTGGLPDADARAPTELISDDRGEDAGVDINDLLPSGAGFSLVDRGQAVMENGVLRQAGSMVESAESDLSNLAQAGQTLGANVMGRGAALLDDATSAVTGGISLAAANLQGRFGTALSGSAIGLQTAESLASGELPTGALLMGADEGLSRLGSVGQRLMPVVNLGATGGQLGQQISGLVDRFSTTQLPSEGDQPLSQLGAVASKLTSGLGIELPEQITAGTLPDTATASKMASSLLGEDVANKVGSLVDQGSSLLSTAGDAGEGIVSSLGEATLDSLSTSEDPIGFVVSAGLGLVTGLAALGESIKDIFSHPHVSLPQIPSLPSFQSGVQQ